MFHYDSFFMIVADFIWYIVIFKHCDVFPLGFDQASVFSNLLTICEQLRSITKYM